MADDEAPASVMRHRLPRGIWALGLVSMLMDVSSEMVHSLLPVFVIVTLGASPVALGLIEGIGDSTASLVKLASGWFSDRVGKRKPLTLAGYGLSAVTKPLFAIAATPAWVLVARFADRVGKGIRVAPRDALVSELAPPGMHGAAFGLRQSLDSVGAIVGPLAAAGLMLLLANDIRSVFWLAVIPGLGAVVTLAAGVREPAGRWRPDSARARVDWRAAGQMGRFFWSVTGIGVALTLARFSEAFLLLRAQTAGLAVALVPLVLVVMNVVYAASAYPSGSLSDRLGRRVVLGIGCAALVAAHAVLAFGSAIWVVVAGVALWGLHLGTSQGLLVALVADATGERLRGTAYGLFHMVCGVAVLVASVLAGMLWQWIGPHAAFVAGAGFALLALGGVVALAEPVRNR